MGMPRSWNIKVLQGEHFLSFSLKIHFSLWTEYLKQVEITTLASGCTIFVYLEAFKSPKSDIYVYMYNARD